MKTSKKVFFAMYVAFILGLMVYSIHGVSQIPAKSTFSVVNGQVMATPKKTKQPDKVVQTTAGVKFYQGSRGGIYYLNDKGKKVYVKK